MHVLKMICTPQHLEKWAALNFKERASKAKQFHQWVKSELTSTCKMSLGSRICFLNHQLV